MYHGGNIVYHGGYLWIMTVICTGVGSRDAYASQNWYVGRLHIFIGYLFVGQLVSEARKGKKRVSSGDLYVACYTLNMWLPLIVF